LVPKYGKEETRMAPGPLDLLTSCRGALLVAAVAVLAGGAVAAHDPIATKVTWDREIAPIINTRCARCHGETDDIPLTTYEQARPWAKAIKEEVLTRRMPKWSAVRGYGDFSNDPSLSPFEIALIAAWADGGAPKALPQRTRPAATFTAPLEFKPPHLPREVTVPCGARTLPAGRLVGIRPHLEPGGSVKVVLDQRMGPEPLLWVKAFDPKLADIYWLRSPIAISRGTHRAVISASAGCSLTLFFGAQP
jgi:hypothetical protein